MNHLLNTNIPKNTPKKYEAIIFDLDGTLYETTQTDILLKELRRVKRIHWMSFAPQDHYSKICDAYCQRGFWWGMLGM